MHHWTFLLKIIFPLFAVFYSHRIKNQGQQITYDAFRLSRQIIIFRHFTIQVDYVWNHWPNWRCCVNDSTPKTVPKIQHCPVAVAVAIMQIVAVVQVRNDVAREFSFIFYIFSAFIQLNESVVTTVNGVDGGRVNRNAAMAFNIVSVI